LEDRVRPLSWRALDAVSREDVRAVSALHRWSRTWINAGDVAHALAGLLDSRVEIVVRRVRGGGAARAADEAVAVVVSTEDGPERNGSAFIECEAPLATALVRRALRRSGPRIPSGGAAALAGAVAAILLATGRRAHARQALRVVAAGAAPQIAAQFTTTGGEFIEASLTVIVDDDAFGARVMLPLARALAAPEPTWTRANLAALGDVPIALPIVAAVSFSTAGELGTLRRGDAWLPGAWSLRRSTAPGATFEGPLLLASPTSETALRAVLGEEGRLVLREGVESLAWTPRVDFGREEVAVSEAERDALVEAVGEVPVVVRVEIGVAEMRARDWASLAPGDVVSLGRKIGDAVTLRVGGVTVARGELVDLEGEVGVRILGRTDGDPGLARPAAKER
jgi:flagellar motor switch/type III secretory pathway protein FliN